MIASILGGLFLLVLVWAATPTACPSCSGTRWRSEHGLQECEACGVWYEPSRGRWRYHRLPTCYRMPGLRGLLYREERP